MSLDIVVEPDGFPAAAAIESATRSAAENVQLAAEVRRIVLVFDAPEFEGAAFWMVERIGEDALATTLYGSPRDVLTTRGPDDDADADIDAEQVRALGDHRLDRLRLDRWLHRNLLQLDDLVRGRVNPQRVPDGRSSALQAVWDVWTDGRLRLRQHPGLTQAERRRIFFRVFAQQGLLLPRHWRTYHELWEGRYEDQDGLLDALGTLPQPTRG